MSALWLAIDTATDVASVAIGTAEQTLAARALSGARQHAAQILPLIQQVLAAARTRLDDVGEIVVGDGPGSFTGVRIGWAAAKGLAHERELPVVALPSLLGTAHAAARANAVPDGASVVAPDVFTIATLATATTVTPVLAAGDGAERYRDEIVRWIGRPPVAPETLPPIAGSLLALAPLAGYAATGEPTYGRPAAAQVKWEASHGRPLPHPSR